MGLPKIDIEFKTRAVTAVQRSQLGIVVLLVNDELQPEETVIYKGIEEVQPDEWTPGVYDYIQKVFLGAPSQVIVERVGESVNDVLSRLNNKRFNYLAFPQIDEEEKDIISSWIKSKRENEQKTFKAVLPNVEGDHEGIINFTTTGITVGEKEYTTAEYTARVAGAAAGLPFTRSLTYYIFPEVDKIDEIENPDTAVDNGELILINDGENIKIGRGVNSLTTTTVEKAEDFKSVRVVEVMDMIKDDIRTTFNDNYVGKVNNTYDNQVLFFRSVNAYFTELSGDDILDPNYENYAQVDASAQRLAWESIGTDTSDWDEQEVKEMSFKRNVFARANVKIIDTMEDLEFTIFI